MANTPTNNPKMECRHCGCRMNEVVNTWIHEVMYMGKNRTIIKRRRICRHCKLPFTTIETYESEDNTNLPEDVQPFRPAPPPSGKAGVYCPTKQPSIPEASGQDASFPPEKPKASRPKGQKGDRRKRKP